MEEALRKTIGRMMTLVPRESFTITLSARHEPLKFYVNYNGQGLTFVDSRFEGFTQVVLPKAFPVEAGTTFDVDSFDIGNMDGASHDEMEGALPERHLFDESTLCAIIATMIAAQRYGEPGKLQHTGKSNLFYLPSHVVEVRWSGGVGLSGRGKGWHVEAYRRRYDVKYSVDSRVFCPVN